MGQLCSKCCTPQDDPHLAEDDVRLERRREIKSTIYAPHSTTEPTWEEGEREEDEESKRDDRPTTVYEGCWQTESGRQDKVMSFVPVPKSVEPVFTRAKVKALEITEETEEPVIRKEKEMRLTAVSQYTLPSDYMSSEEINDIAEDLFLIEGVTFCGANEHGGITVLVLQEYVEESTPLIKGMVHSHCSKECTVDVGAAFCHHARFEAGQAIGGRTIGFVGVCEDQPVILTAAHNIGNDLVGAPQVTQERKRLAGCSFDMKFLTFRNQKIVTGNGTEHLVNGIGVISTFKKGSEEPDFGNHQVERQRQTKGKSLQEERRPQTLLVPAADVAVFALDKFEFERTAKAPAQPGIPTTVDDVCNSLPVVQDSTSFFVGEQIVHKTGAKSDLTMGKVTAVNGVLHGVLNGGEKILYKNVIQVTPLDHVDQFSVEGDSGAGVLTGTSRPSAVGFVLGGEDVTQNLGRKPYGYCTLLKDNLEVLRQHPDPTINGRSVKDIHIVEGALIHVD